MGRDIKFLRGLVGAFVAISPAALCAGLPHHYMDELLIGMSIFSVFTVAGWWPQAPCGIELTATSNRKGARGPGRLLGGEALMPE